MSDALFGPGRLGLLSGGPTHNATTELTALSTPSADAADQVKLWHPDNPLLAFGAIAALTFGLMAFSTSVRVGKTTASVAVGST